MSSTVAPTVASTSSLSLPVAAIVCIAIGSYVLLIVIILIIRSILLSRGICRQSCYCCGKEGEPCCQCCATLAEMCSCCDSPSLQACLDSICPARKQMDFGDFVTCQCCTDPNNTCCTCCNSQQPLFDCGMCNCECTAPECNDINCCCFKFQQKALPPDDDSN